MNWHPLRTYYELARSSAGLLTAAAVVLGFALAGNATVFLLVELPEVPAGLEWTRNLGLGLGALLATGICFLGWLFFSATAFLGLSLFDSVPKLEVVTRVVGLSFIFPLIGRVLALLAAFWGLPEVVFIVFSLSGIVAGVLAAGLGFHFSGESSLEDGLIVSVSGLVLLQLGVLLLRTVGG